MCFYHLDNSDITWEFDIIWKFSDITWKSSDITWKSSGITWEI